MTTAIENYNARNVAIANKDKRMQKEKRRREGGRKEGGKKKKNIKEDNKEGRQVTGGPGQAM